MALSFKSAQRRAFWGAIAFSLAVEYVIFFVAFWFWSGRNGYSWVWALSAVVAIQIFMMLYGLLSFGRRALWYFWFERDTRVQAIANEFNRLNFPRPDGFYNDADQYLEQVALSPASSPEAALFAGVLLGILNGHRTSGPRSEAFFLALSIERAMQQMLPWNARADLIP